MEIRDPYGLFRWYQSRFMPHTLADPDFDFQRVFGLLTLFQVTFNAATENPCRGLNFMRHALKKTRRGTQYCGHPLCPSCWHRRMVALARRLLEPLGGPGAKTLYLRSTWFVKWDHDIHPRCVTRFKGIGSQYELIAYTLNWDAAVTELDSPDARYDEFHGQLAYQLYGLFWARKAVRDTQDTCGQVNVREDPRDPGSAAVGIVDREFLETAERARQVWWTNLRHPWEYRGHNLLADYVKRFQDYKPAGRSWLRVQSPK